MMTDGVALHWQVSLEPGAPVVVGPIIMVQVFYVATAYSQ
jgi:hypothetical protein